ncbi:MAG: HAMP domain-containing histidine kinase [Spirochaetia bacterium]|nr:HAMP domain-containing histidine kinase [Spirochaetia bacterium]
MSSTKINHRLLKLVNPLLGTLDIFIPRMPEEQINFDQRLKMRTAVFIGYLVLFTSFIFSIRFYFYYKGFNLFTFLLVFSIALTVLSLRNIKKNTFLNRNFLLLLIYFIAVNYILMYHNAGKLHTGLLWNFVIAIIAVFLLGPATGGLLVLVSVIFSVFLYWLEANGFEFPRHNHPMDQNKSILIFSTILVLITVIITWLYEISRNNALQMERINNTKLKEENIKRISAENNLAEANKNLENRIEEEIKKALLKEKYFSQQARLIAMGEMIGAIAHQWRQPLNAIALIVQDLQEAYATGDLDDSYFKSRVTQTMEYIEHMSQTIDDFRDFSKPSKTSVEFNVIQTIKDSLKIADARLKNNSIEIVLIGHEDKADLLIKGYPNEFKQVILNILNNSIDAIEEYRIKQGNPDYIGKIEITLQDKKILHITIDDNGGGIWNEAMPFLFEPYFSTKGADKGTGIGLYMAKKIIEESHSGWLFAENIENGARFIIVLNVI